MAELRLRRDGSDETTTHTPRSGPFLKGGPYWHHVRLTDLEPDTTYHLDVPGEPDRHFITAPAEDKAFRLLVGGDSRSGLKTRKEVNAMMSKLCVKHPDILALAHGGDYIVSGTRWPLWESWLTDHEKTAAPDGRLLPVIPARGNHDGGEHYNQVFGLNKAHADGIFSTVIGGEAFALITLNTNDPGTGPQRDWLEAELERLRPKHRWLLAQYHRPMYPAYKSPATHKPAWVPLFDKFNVDVCLESDGHNIKRTVPIRNDREDPTGVTYVGEGGLGVPQRTPKPGRWYLEAPGMADSGHHVTVLHVQAEKLDYQVLRLEGALADSHTWRPRADRNAVPAPLPNGALVKGGATWRYQASDKPKDAKWASPDFDDGAWSSGAGGFGYGDGDDRTVIDMKDKHRCVFTRTTFELDAPVNSLQLKVNYDDGFIAYLNGREVARANVREHRGDYEVNSHEAEGHETFRLRNLAKATVSGRNVVAIVGFNRSKGSSDFTLDAILER